MNRYGILIIDDDESTQDVLGALLKLAGYEVYNALDGAAGLAQMNKVRPDLVILDINMPVMDGFETMKAIAGSKALAGIPVLFLTGSNDHTAKVRGLELGAEDYIVKPYNRVELLARIKGALRRSGRYRQNEKAMEGDLAEITLVELLQTFDMGRKTGRIMFRETGGEIHLENGELIHAAYRDFTGRDALIRLLFLAKGSFSVNFDPPPDGLARNVISIQAALFDSMVYLDELRVIVNSISPEDVLVEIGADGISKLVKYRDLSPLGLYELIAVMDGDLKENAGKTASEFAAGRVTALPATGAAGPGPQEDGTRTSGAEEPPQEKFAHLFEMGFDKYREGRYSEALSLWEEALVLKPADKKLLANIPLLRKKLKQA
jgi:DNA-binding response OmpR family regulator